LRIADGRHWIVIIAARLPLKGGTAEREEGIVLAPQPAAVRTGPANPLAPTGIAWHADRAGKLRRAHAQVLANRPDVGRVAPGGNYDRAKAGEYVENFKKAVVTDPKATFAVRGEFDGKTIRLSGETSRREYHDQLIDLLVAMRLFNIANDIRFPKKP